jgi:uncharacterized protein
MQFAKAKKFILDRLKTELPAHLSYHCFDHTQDVYKAAENLCDLEKINPYQKKLVLTAALFHDSGFIIGINCHEEESCRIAEQCLPSFGYTNDDLAAIKGMIMATKLPQSPKNHLEEIIADADLDYLGRDDFFRISNLLYQEFRTAGIVNTTEDWNKLQVSFFRSHHFFTKTALKLRQDKKMAHLLAVTSKLRSE